jgi:hypothetical protein
MDIAFIYIYNCFLDLLFEKGDEGEKKTKYDNRRKAVFEGLYGYIVNIDDLREEEKKRQRKTKRRATMTGKAGDRVCFWKVVMCVV